MISYVTAKGERRCRPTPHHKTQYLTTPLVWRARFTRYLGDLLRELGYQVSLQEGRLLAVANRDDEMKDISLTFNPAPQGEAGGTIELSRADLLGSVESLGSFQTWDRWRGYLKEPSHQNSAVGNEFLARLRDVWKQDNYPTETIPAGAKVIVRWQGVHSTAKTYQGTVQERMSARGRTMTFISYKVWMPHYKKTMSVSASQIISWQ